jgi:thioredoxin-dependent peroxiredoxin
MSGLKEGDKAPAFTGVDQDGKAISLKDYKGRYLVLYFYPKDDTPACTAEACSLRDHYRSFVKKGYSILGVSTDSPKKHRRFIDKYKLPFPLLSDPGHEIADLYGVWGEKMLFGRKYMGILRTTFVIDKKGVIEQIISKVDTKEHASQIL